eukprot:m.217592 g.217592  ORF g.217592 m.217592 type:complete len:250 (+) comp26250_c0_seq4:150-899(+)
MNNYCTSHKNINQEAQTKVIQPKCTRKRMTGHSRPSLSSSKDPSKPNQWYRLITAIFLHAGVIHLAANLLMQWTLGCAIERAAGWLRTAIIYLIAGVGGNIFSAVFSATVPEVGASGAIYGLLGVTVVDLFQSWQVIPNPWSQFFKTMLQLIVFLGIGTLPWVDNFAHFGGFIFGVLASIIFLPYITFGKWDKVRKRCLLVICFPLLLVCFFILFVIFYEVQGTDFCPNCKYIQCVPYTADLCDKVVSE